MIMTGGRNRNIWTDNEERQCADCMVDCLNDLVIVLG
jgi:hypothetical protein